MIKRLRRGLRERRRIASFTVVYPRVSLVIIVIVIAAAVVVTMKTHT